MPWIVAVIRRTGRWCFDRVVCVLPEEGSGTENILTMKLSVFFSASAAQFLGLFLLSADLSQSLNAAPSSSSPDYTVSVFANAPNGLSGPDSITYYKGTIFIQYANGTTPTGGGGDSTIVQFSSTGKVLRTYRIPGKVDGLKYNPFDGKIWALQNEDANPSLTLIDPVSHTMKHYRYAAPTLHGGGYDDVVFLNGQVFISASNPNLQTPTSSTPNGQNIFPSIIKATIEGEQVEVEPVLMGNATLIDVTTGQSVVAQQSDPDSLKVDPSGNLVLDSQADGDLIFLNAPGAPNQVGYRLHLSNGAPTQVTVDDTVFPTQASGTIYVADTSANVVYAVTSTVFPPNSAFSASDTTGVLGRVDLTTGQLVPVIAGMVSPHGALFVPSLPEVRLDQVSSSAGAGNPESALVRVSRTGAVSKALQVFLSISDSETTESISQAVTIPPGASSAIATVHFKSVGGSKRVQVSIQPDPNYNPVPDIVNTAVQVLSEPLPR